MPSGRTRAENIGNRYNPHQEITAYKAALRAFVEAWGHLVEEWERLEFAGANVPNDGTKNYPFSQSFDELYHEVIEWAHEIENEDSPLAWNVASDVAPVTSSLEIRARKIAADANAAVREYRKRSKTAGLTTAWEPIEDMGAYMQLRDGELISCPMNADGSREENPSMEVNIDPDIPHDAREVNMDDLDLEQLRAIKHALRTEISPEGNEIHEI